MPSPAGFVVKKGLNIFSFTSAGMPVPLSRIRPEKKTRADAGSCSFDCEGIEGVTITDKDGKTYYPADFRVLRHGS